MAHHTLQDIDKGLDEALAKTRRINAMLRGDYHPTKTESPNVKEKVKT